eukprot:TRINITY_DN2539_c0_g1_i1.p1 TRINITY_DN2539_c0_g1~~TRINITY_DN2539_c0_g1_i1.p1  ORF type:complete len:592 (-),score=156.46 TRINITY_DN2539_c0_g1_i1:705-2480(-)
MTAVVDETRSDTVHVVLPYDMDLHSATLALSEHGEVSCLEMIPGDQLTIAAVFFDVRAADRALAEFGTTTCCWRGPERRSRVVRIPGGSDVAARVVAAEDAGGVVAQTLPVSEGGDDKGSDGPEVEAAATDMLVEFFDVRVAARMRYALGQADEEDEDERFALVTDAGQPDASACWDAAVASGDAADKADADRSIAVAAAAPSHDRGRRRASSMSMLDYAAPVPVFVKATDDVAAEETQEGTHIPVLVRNIPNLLLSSPEMMEVVLQQAGLVDAVGSFEIWPAEPCGDALLRLVKSSLLDQCVRHFEGCHWDVSGQPVTTRLLSPAEEAEELKQRGCKALPSPVMALPQSFLRQTDRRLPLKVQVSPVDDANCPKPVSAAQAAASAGMRSVTRGRAASAPATFGWDAHTPADGVWEVPPAEGVWDAMPAEGVWEVPQTNDAWGVAPADGYWEASANAAECVWDVAAPTAYDALEASAKPLECVWDKPAPTADDVLEAWDCADSSSSVEEAPQALPCVTKTDEKGRTDSNATESTEALPCVTKTDEKGRTDSNATESTEAGQSTTEEEEVDDEVESWRDEEADIGAVTSMDA